MWSLTPDTFITQVEARFNSRPLIALSNEPNDPSYLLVLR